MSLLDKTISSSYNENKIIKRMSDLSYSTLNGQRQEVIDYAPEGVVMLGQLSREKPDMNLLLKFLLMKMLLLKKLELFIKIILFVPKLLEILKKLLKTLIMLKKQ